MKAYKFFQEDEPAKTLFIHPVGDWEGEGPHPMAFDFLLTYVLKFEVAIWGIRAIDRQETAPIHLSLYPDDGYAVLNGRKYFWEEIHV